LRFRLSASPCGQEGLPTAMERALVLQLLDYADPENLGGASRVALSLAPELNGVGFEVLTFAGCVDKQGRREIGGLRFCFFPSPPSEERTVRSNLKLFSEPARFFRRFLRASPNLIFAHQPFVWWSLRRLLPSVPLVYYFHSPWPEEYLVRRSGNGGGLKLLQVGTRLALERWALRKARLVFVASRYMLSRFKAWHRCLNLTGKVRLLGFGVDMERFGLQGPKEALRRRLGLPARSEVLISVRRLEDRMGLDKLLEACALLRARHPSLFVVLVGIGRLEGDLRALARRLGLEGCVRFWGYADEQDLPRLYAAADLFVLPTQQLEGFGLVSLEASACGTPVVATPVGGIPEVLRPIEPHFLARGTDERALSEAIERALAAKDYDPRKLRRSVASAYSWRAAALRFKHYVEPLLSDFSLAGGVGHRVLAGLCAGAGE